MLVFSLIFKLSWLLFEQIKKLETLITNKQTNKHKTSPPPQESKRKKLLKYSNEKRRNNAIPGVIISSIIHYMTHEPID